MTTEDNNNIYFEKIVTNESPFQIKFDQGNMVFLTQFSISHSNPGSTDKKLKCYATYDTLAPDSDDESADGTFTGRESAELACFVIGHKVNTLKIEYAFSAGMHPVISVEGPGSIKVEGFFKDGTDLDDDFNPEEEDQSDSFHSKSTEQDGYTEGFNNASDESNDVGNQTDSIEQIKAPKENSDSIHVEQEKYEKTLTRPPDDDKVLNDDPDWLSGETSEGM